MKPLKIEKLLGVGFFLLVWEIIARSKLLFFLGIIKMENLAFPPTLLSVSQAFFHDILNGTLILSIEYSIIHLLIGLTFAVLLGIPLGIITGWSKRIEYIIDPIIQIMRPIPPLAWIPMAILMLGLTHQAAGFIIFMGAFFPIMVNTYSGVKGTDRRMVEMARTLGANDRQILTKVVLPYSTPMMTAGIRISLGVGWMCVVAAEMFGVSKYGLGWMIPYYSNTFAYDYVFAYMIVLGLIGYAMDTLFKRFESWKLRWRETI
jgi:NitT/TauT family transport system permease protein